MRGEQQGVVAASVVIGVGALLLAGCGGGSDAGGAGTDAGDRTFRDGGALGVDADTGEGGACRSAGCSEACRCVVTLASNQAQPAALAVDGKDVYWINNGGGTGVGSVMKVPVDGGVATTLASAQDSPQAMVVAGANVYWTNYGWSDTVMTVPKDGGIPTVVAPSQNNAHGAGIAADASSIYWIVAGGMGSNLVGNGIVMKAPLAGGTPATLAVVDSPAGGVAVDAASVYWTSIYGSDAVMKMPMDGGTPVTLASIMPVNSALAIAVDTTNVYWTNAYNGRSVLKVPVAGGTPTTLASGQQNPASIAVDEASVYWANRDDGTVMKVPIGGGALTTLASGQSDPYGIAVDGTSVYWTNPYGPSGSGPGAVMKVTPK